MTGEKRRSSGSHKCESPESRPSLRSERVPYEIWLQIIESTTLDHSDIVNLTLVSKFLRYVAQPMLFSEFKVSIPRVRYLDSVTPVRCQDISYHDRLKQRLEFASYPRIVQAVKSLSIRMGEERRDLRSQETVTEESVVQTVFDQLSHFVNLRSFFAQDVALTGAHFDALAQLKYFSGIHLERCKCTGDLGLARLKLKYLSLHGRMTGTHGWWIPLLKCPTLEHLSYEPAVRSTSGTDDPELLFPAVAVSPVMHSLRTLRLPANAYFLPCFSLALARCSSVEELFIGHVQKFYSPLPFEVDLYNPLPSNVLPNLKAINAPLAFVQGCILLNPDVPERKNLKHITLPDYLRPSLEILQIIKERCPALEELVIHAFSLHDTVALDMILTGMASLRGLHLTVQHVNMPFKDVQRFFQKTAYPPGIRTIHVVLPGPRKVTAKVLGDVRRLMPLITVTDTSSSSSPPSPTKKRSGVIERMRKKAPSIVEIEIALQKIVTWRDMYTRSVKWYTWSERGGHEPLPEVVRPFDPRPSSTTQISASR